MADKKKATEQVSEQEGRDYIERLMKAVEGHDCIEFDDDEGNTWKAGYDRALVKRMEAKGFKIADAFQSYDATSLTGAEDFYLKFAYPAFKKYQPDMTEGDFFKVIAAIPDKSQFLELMMGLYMQPVMALTRNPTQSRMKFRLL